MEQDVVQLFYGVSIIWCIQQGAFNPFIRSKDAMNAMTQSPDELSLDMVGDASQQILEYLFW